MLHHGMAKALGIALWVVSNASCQQGAAEVPQDAAEVPQGAAEVPGESAQDTDQSKDQETTAPEISGGLPTGTLAAGTSSAIMSVTTDVPASCKWDSSSETLYAAMANDFSTTGETEHSIQIADLSDGQSYVWFVRCTDASGNTNDTAYAVSFSVASRGDGSFSEAATVDRSAPTISYGKPSGVLAAGTTSTTMRVTTNEAATCKFDTSPGIAYWSMANTFTTTGGTSHSRTLTGLVGGQTYNRYVRCKDASGNANSVSYTITFSVARADTSAPLVSNGQPTGTLAAGTTSATLRVTTNEAATCKADTLPSTTYENMTRTFTTTGGTTHSAALTWLRNGETYYRYIRCKDTAGNTNTVSYKITFSVANPISSATLAWEPPTRRADGTPLTDLAGYNVHYGTSSGSYSTTDDLGMPACAPNGTTIQCTHQVQGLGAGVWYFVVTAYDSAGKESDYSNEATGAIN